MCFDPTWDEAEASWRGSCLLLGAWKVAGDEISELGHWGARQDLIILQAASQHGHGPHWRQ